MEIKSTIAIVIILVFVFFMLGLLWLGIATIIFVLVYKVSLHCISLIRFVYFRKPIKYIFQFLFVITSIVFLKLFVVDIYKIPSSSMENLLYPNDVVVVNKLKYGPKLPRSPFEIPLVNLVFYFDEDALTRIKKNWWEYSRWNGTTTVEQGDVFVFNSNWDINFIMVKRCIGLPGDTIKIKQGKVYRNALVYNAPKTVKNSYKFKIIDKKALYEIMDSLSIDCQIKNDSIFPNWANANFSMQELQLLQKMESIDSIKKSITPYNISQKELLRTSTSKWTLDNMGPVIIPKKGMIISLNPDTFMLYKKVINQSEKSGVKEINEKYYIKGKLVTQYRFKQNYYFMIGDNRKETSDSRCWGFLPETNIIGKVQCVLWSNKNDEFQWDRFLKILN